LASVVNIKEKFPGVFWIEFEDGSKILATKNLTPGFKVYDEKLIKHKGIEYRSWNPYRSKLAAAIIKGLKEFPIKEGQRILYLGIASGTTASHISDIIGKSGIIYGIEFAHRPLRDLLRVARIRRNIIPLLKDARLPGMYDYIGECVDGIYCDVAQPDQARILADNAKMFLKSGGWFMIAIKARSIDVTRPPEEIYKEQAEFLKNEGLKVVEQINIEPYSRDHVMFIGYRE